MLVRWAVLYEGYSRVVRDELSVMSAFLAVADEKSFTKAAKRLGVTQSALSHAIRGLEEQVGVRLLARTTRSVAPTEAGEQLLAELRPALTGIRGALDRIGGLRDQPRGRLRLLVPRLAAMSVLGPKLAAFARSYPDVVLDVSTDETRLDLVASGFDAGVQYGEFIQHDMVAVRVSPDHRPAIVGSPGTSRIIRSRAHRTTCSSIAALITDMVQERSIVGNSIKVISRWSSPSTGR